MNLSRLRTIRTYTKKNGAKVTTTIFWDRILIAIVIIDLLMTFYPLFR
ncbi:MAG: hypothetical protein K9G46_07000 [Flavobacteriales bacterium]|nr:hypothetical protein [Flavobacteriales bacterium]